MMISVREAGGKKGELLQLRVDKPFLDQLNAIADEQHVPLSVLLRSWLSERLRKELIAANVGRLDWQEKRWEHIKSVIEKEYGSGPIIVIHAFPLTPGVMLDPEKMKSSAGSLVPFHGSLPIIGRINRLGYEVSCEYQNKTVRRAQFFKTGQIEGIWSVDSSGNEILGMALDHGIVTMIQSYVGLLAGQQITLPYLFRVSFLRFKNYWLTDYPTVSNIPRVAFEEDFFTLQDVLITDFNQTDTQSKIAEHIKPMLDELWNASGIGRSPSYSNSGQWNERK